MKSIIILKATAQQMLRGPQNIKKSYIHLVRLLECNLIWEGTYIEYINMHPILISHPF